MKLNVGDTLFEKKDVHKYTWVTRVDGSKSLSELTVVQKEDMNKLLDVNAFIGAGRKNLETNN